MFIYIDESGSFAYPKNHRHSYACGGALTIPDRSHSMVLKSFKTLTRKWGLVGQEIKGRSLCEAQVADVLRMLGRNNAKFHACVTDMLDNPPDALAARKEDQAKRLLANLTERHHPNLVRQLREAAVKMHALADQLFLQLCIMVELVNSQLRDAMIYFAKVDPPELGRFRWIIDRKGRKETIYEELWRTLLTPFIQGRQFSDNFNDRIIFLEGGDYSHCARFFRTIDKWPEHLPERSPGLRRKTQIEVADISVVLRESFTLANSAEHPGLQLADIVTNALRRAMMGNLQELGWSDLGNLMFRWKDKSIRLVHFGDG